MQSYDNFTHKNVKCALFFKAILQLVAQYTPDKPPYMLLLKCNKKASQI